MFEITYKVSATETDVMGSSDAEFAVARLTERGFEIVSIVAL